MPYSYETTQNISINSHENQSINLTQLIANSLKGNQAHAKSIFAFYVLYDAVISDLSMSRTYNNLL